MRTLAVARVTEKVADLVAEANYLLPDDLREALAGVLEREESPLGREVLERIRENGALAAAGERPVCQDTGHYAVYLDIGQDLHLVGGDLAEAVQEGVRRGSRRAYLRPSVVEHPWRRGNTGDNTPAILEMRVVPGDLLRIAVLPKGGGAENMSALRMLRPADGLPGVKDFVLESVGRAGPNACPPFVVGVGVGANFEGVAALAKRAMLRPLRERHPDPETAAVERELLERVNELGIGPAGLGGRVTALAVNIETAPTHIAALPVAVSLSCHAWRHREAVL